MRPLHLFRVGPVWRLWRHFSWVLIVVLALVWASAARSQVVINEVLANNVSNAPFAAFPAYFPDYVELYNTTASDINLAAGWSLSTKRTPNAASFKDLFYFPPGSVIPAQSHLLVFFDGSTNLPGIHTSFTVGGTNIVFTLKRTGDDVLLFNGNTKVDSISFGPQIPGYSIGRIPDFNGTFTLNIPSPCGGTIACQPNSVASFLPAPGVSNQFTLKINEWLATNSAGATKDWFELYNPSNRIVELSGLVFTDNHPTQAATLRAVPPLSYIAPLGFVQYFASGSEIASDEVKFSLSSTSGDEIWIFAADRTTVIDKVASTLIQQRDISQGRLPDGAATIISLPSLSPKANNFGNIPEVTINEVLTHTDPPLEDAIELQNVTNAPVNIGNWWLSNDPDRPKKFRIPANTILPPGAFVVFYEQRGNPDVPGFNHSGTGNYPDFTLDSAHGDVVYLSKGDANGDLTGYRRNISVDSSENGVSFGRHINSQGGVDFVPMKTLSFGTAIQASDPGTPANLSIFRTGTGATNSAPKVGPVVINEIYFHPPDIITGTNVLDNSLDEFIELFNVTTAPVLLYDPNFYFDNNGLKLPPNTLYADGRTNTWRIGGGVSYEFPPDNVSLAAGQFLLLVNFDPTNTPVLHAFTNKFKISGVPTRVQVFGPYKGKLSNGGASVDLFKPDPPQGPQHPDFRYVPYIPVDRVKYSDRAPWPANTDGTTNSLQRISSYDYGDEPMNWRGANATPGRFNTPLGIEAPTISVQPAPHTVSAGSTTTFTVLARGGGLHYQWSFNQTELVNATNSMLRLINLSTNQSGLCQVVITNVAGAVTSVVAQLTVTPANPDSIRPTVATTSPSTSIVPQDSMLIRGSASDNIGVYSVLYSINDSAFNSATGSVTWSVWGVPGPVFLNPGTNVVRAFSVDHAGNHSLTNVRSYFHSVPVPLTLSINGRGTIAGATNQQRFDVGRNLTLTALPAPGMVFSNWVVTTNLTLASVHTAPSLIVMMESNLAVTANFVTNPYVRVAGQFNGIFYDTNDVLPGSAGSFTLSLTDRGTYTASLLGAGRRLSVAGRFDLDGRATNRILRLGTNAITVIWGADFHGTDRIVGTVSDGSWTAQLEGDRAVFNAKTNPCPKVGRYTFIIPGTPGQTLTPGGNSFGTALIDSNGIVSMTFSLADKTPAVLKVPLSKNAEWPVYVPLYLNKGSLLAWVHFTNGISSDFEGNSYWFKPALPTAKYYPAGFLHPNSQTLSGSRYLPPVGLTNRILTFTNGLVILNGNNLSTALTNAIILGPGSRVTNAGPNKLSVSFALPTGLFQGTFSTAGSTQIVSFSGAVLQKSTNALGFFLGTNQSGRVEINAAP